MGINAASVVDMIKKLSEKKLIIYEKNKGAKLTIQGYKIAVDIVRKHRLWEVFLLEKIGLFLGCGSRNCRTTRAHQTRRIWQTA